MTSSDERKPGWGISVELPCFLDFGGYNGNIKTKEAMTVKKKLALIFALVLSVSLCACGGDIEVPTRPAESVTTPTRLRLGRNDKADGAEQAKGNRKNLAFRVLRPYNELI